jgi:methanogenic corrinoid protein MtbC1
MYDVILGGHAEEAAAVLVSLHLEGAGVAALADEVLCPAMRRVGELWHQGELSVAQEHVATRAALEALQALRASLHAHAAHGRRAVCCATEEDFHELPVQVAALVLEARGWEVVNLGTSTPFYALAEAMERFAPRLVCVAATILEGLDRAAREYGEVRKAAARYGASLVIGGAGFAEEDVRRRFPAELHAGDFRQLEEFAVSLSEEGGTG